MARAASWKSGVGHQLRRELPAVGRDCVAGAAGASFTTPASVVIDATAADGDGLVQQVDFVDGALVGSDARRRIASPGAAARSAPTL